MPRIILTLFLLTATLLQAQEINGLRGKVLSYDTDEQRFVIRSADGKEHTLRWTSASKLADKKRMTDFANVANAGQDAAFLLGYGWRQAIEAGKISAQRGYLYDTNSEKKARLPDTESAVISGVLRATSDHSGILTVNDREFAVDVVENPSFISIRPTIPNAIFRSTEDVRVWASRIDGELLVHKVEFYSGDWPNPKAAPQKSEKTVRSGTPSREPPKEIRHAPATATGNGFTRTISKDFGGTLPKAANVTRRRTNNNNYRDRDNRNNNNRNRKSRSRR